MAGIELPRRSLHTHFPFVTRSQIASPSDIHCDVIGQANVTVHDIGRSSQAMGD